MSFFLDRLSERSTWRGLAMMLTALGVSIEPQLMEAIIVFGLGAVGLAESLLPDPSGKMKT
jgi:hypothetical protein